MTEVQLNAMNQTYSVVFMLLTVFFFFVINFVAVSLQRHYFIIKFKN